jgi:hypothetical protein
VFVIQVAKSDFIHISPVHKRERKIVLLPPLALMYDIKTEWNVGKWPCGVSAI